MDIGAPTGVQHIAHVEFDAERVAYKGLPEEWHEQGANSQFGVEMRQLPRLAVPGYTARIPAVLVALRGELLRLGGCKEEGVFRVAANKDDQKFYRSQLNSGTFETCGKEDGHCMSALIKQFFRELPTPLLNPVGRDAMASLGMSKEGEREMCVTRFHLQIPEPNNSVFLWLLDLMLVVTKHGAVNRMGSRAIAVVFAPNLFQCPEGTAPMEVMVMADHAVKVLQHAMEFREADLLRVAVSAY